MESTSKTQQGNVSESWPALPFEAWRDTCETLHLWMQIVGKVRMELSPFVNHWWHVTLFITPRGLTTSAIPYHGGTFEVTFDFIDHTLRIFTSEGTSRALPLIPRSVAAFYQEFMGCLRALGIEVTINTLPSEVQNPIRCDEDELHASYDPVYAHRFWRILVQVDKVFKEFRSPFLGKCSPIQVTQRSQRLRSTRIRFLNRLASRQPLSGLLQPTTVPTKACSSCATMMCGTLTRLNRCFRSSSRVPTKPGQRWRSGIEKPWKDRIQSGSGSWLTSALFRFVRAFVSQAPLPCSVWNAQASQQNRWNLAIVDPAQP